MGFMASFWGNMASQHQQTTQDWKRLWQVDADRELRERQLKEEAERAERQERLARDQMQQEDDHFRVSEEIERLKLDLETTRVNQNYVDSTLGRIMPVFQSSDYVRQRMIVDSLTEAAGDNELFAPVLAAMRGGIRTSDISLPDARKGLAAFFDPTSYINEFGFAPQFSDFEINSFLAAFEGTPDYGPLMEEVERTREARQEQADFINSHAVRQFVLKTETAEATVDSIRTGTDFTAAQIEDLTFRTELAQETASSVVRKAMAEADLAELDFRNAEVASRFLKDTLVLELENLTQQVRSVTNNNDLFEDLYDTVIDRTMAELDQLNIANALSRSDLRVALATETPRIYGEFLKVEQVQAGIDHIRHSIAHDQNLRSDALMTLGFNLVAEGHTPMLEEFWDQLFPDTLADKERTMELVTSYTQGIQESNELEAAARLAHTTAATEQMVMQTRYIPMDYQIRQGQLALGRDQLNFQYWDATQRHLTERAKLEAGSQIDIIGATDVVSDAFEFTLEDVLGHIDSAHAAELRLQNLLDFNETLTEGQTEAVVTADNISTLSAYYTALGISAPELGHVVDLSRMGEYVSMVQTDLERATETAVARGAILYGRAASLVNTGEVPDIATFFGRPYNPDGDSLFDDMFNEMVARGPEYNRAVIENELLASQVSLNIFGDDVFSELGPAATFQQIVMQVVPDPLTLANTPDSVLESMYDNLVHGETGRVLGFSTDDRREALEAAGMDTFEGFKSFLWEMNGRMDQHVSLTNDIRDDILIPMPEVSASLFTGEGQLQQFNAFNTVLAHVGAATNAIQNGYLEPMFMGHSTEESNARLANLSDMLGMDIPTMEAMGFIRPYETDSPGVPRSERGSRYLPNTSDIIAFLDQEAFKAARGMAALTELSAGAEPSVFISW